MANVTRVGADLFSVGVVNGPGASTVRVEGLPVGLVGDFIAPHGKSPHTTATIVTGSSSVFIEGRPVSAVGLSVATCGHRATTGAPTVYIGR